MDAMELYLENIGDDNAPLVCAMGEEYTTAEIKKIILDTICLFGEEGGEDAEVNEKVLLRLLAFVAMEPVPEGMEELGDYDRYSCIRKLEAIRKRESTSPEERQKLFLLQYLLRGYAAKCH
ncbi:MAG: hypothetical protein K6E71_05620 [Lachnospiraceae bacterium]|nr:hypothetical protein [Lachnospiraceae bacterium]